MLFSDSQGSWLPGSVGVKTSRCEYFQDGRGRKIPGERRRGEDQGGGLREGRGGRAQSTRGKRKKPGCQDEGVDLGRTQREEQRGGPREGQGHADGEEGGGKSPRNTLGEEVPGEKRSLGRSRASAGKRRQIWGQREFVVAGWCPP